MTLPQERRLYPGNITHAHSKNISNLVQSIPELLDERGRGICEHGPINYVGSLLVLLNNKKYTDLIKEGGYTPANEITTPITYETVVLQSSNDGQIPIITNQACGPHPVGLAIAGPYAGLMISGGRNPMRLFNDTQISDANIQKPYTPLFTSEQGIMKFPLPPELLNFINIMTKIFNMDYTFIVEKSKSKHKGEVYTSDLLFDLCDELQIPIDKLRFQFTRSFT